MPRSVDQPSGRLGAAATAGAGLAGSALGAVAARASSSDRPKGTDGAAVEAAKTMGVTDDEVVQQVLIPAAWPAMLDTLRAMMGLSWTYLVVAELVAASSGLGFSILKAQRFLMTDQIFAGILLIGALGLATDQGLRWLHRRVFPWHHLRS